MTTRSRHELSISTTVRDRASKELKGIGKTGEKAGKSIALGFIQAQVAIAGMKAAVRLAINLVKGITSDVATMGDDFAKMGRQLGVSVEVLSGFDFVAKLAGADIKTLGIGFKTLAKNMNDFSQGTGEAADAFRELGIDVVDNEGKLRSLDAVFLDIADAFKDMEKGSKQAALAQEIFGGRAIKLVPILQQGSAAIREQLVEAKAFGLVFGKAAAKAAEDFVDAKLRLDSAITGIKIAIGTELLPSLTVGFERIAKFLASQRESIADAALQIVKDVASVTVTVLGELIKVAGDAKDFFDELQNSFLTKKGRKSLLRSFAGLDEPAAKRIAEAAFGNQQATERLAKSTGDIWRAEFLKLAADMEAAFGKIGRGISSGLSDAALRAAAQSFLDLSITGQGPAREVALRRAAQDMIDRQSAAGPERLFDSGALGRLTTGADGTDINKGLGGLAREVEKMPPLLDRFRSGMVDATKAMLDGVDTATLLGDTLVSSAAAGFSRFFDAIIFGSASAKDAFRAFALDIIRSLQQIAAQQLALQLINSFLGGVATTGGGLTASEVSAGANGAFRGSRIGAGGKGLTITQNINAGPGANPAEIKALAKQGVLEALRTDRGFLGGVRRAANTGLQ